LSPIKVSGGGTGDAWPAFAREASTGILADAFAKEPKGDWHEQVPGHVSVPLVWTPGAALHDFMLGPMGTRKVIEHPRRLYLQGLAAPLKQDGNVHPIGLPPWLVANSDSILADLGYDPGAIARLPTRSAGVNAGEG
jgi:hypothetical protein